MAKFSKGPSGFESQRGRACASSDDGAGFAGGFGTLSTTIGRALEFRGRVADATALAEKLVELGDSLRFDLARAECEAATSTRFGRDFSSRRARLAAEGLREEIEDAEAMLSEVDGVLRRLRREQRVLQQRLSTSSDLVAGLPPGPERARLAALLVQAHASLDVPCGRDAAAKEAAAGALYTFTRGEAKQTGQAR